MINEWNLAPYFQKNPLVGATSKGISPAHGISTGDLSWKMEDFPGENHNGM